MKHIKYGLDAPIIPTIYILWGIVSLFINPLNWLTISISGLFLICGFIFIHTSLIGKSRIWDQIINELEIPKSSKIIDLGTGHGAVLVKFANKIGLDGNVIGVDIWKSSDQLGNSQKNTQQIINSEGVSEKARLLTADMVNLPLASNSFDFVVSSFAFHNIKPLSARKKAIKEAIRILKPNGQLVIVDTGYNLNNYLDEFNAMRLHSIKKRIFGFNGWWTGPWMSSYVVQGKK